MSLPNPIPTPAQPKTKDQLLVETVARINASRLTLGRMCLATYQGLLNLVRNNPNGLTKDEINAKLGTAASTQLWAEAGRLKALINAAAPGTIVDDVPEWTLTPPA